MPSLKWKDIQRDPELKKLFFRFTQGEFSEENTMFLSLKLNRSSNFERIYDTYIADNARHAINVPDHLKRELDKLAAELRRIGAENWSDMLATMSRCQKEIENLIERDTLRRFQKSDAYLEYLDPPTRGRR